MQVSHPRILHPTPAASNHGSIPIPFRIFYGSRDTIVASTMAEGTLDVVRGGNGNADRRTLGQGL
jgi:hypothetical protein